MKKVLSVFIAICMLFAFVTAAFAGGSYKDAAKLRFDENGKFKILVLADVQDDYPIEEDTVEFIKEAIDYSKPDIIVFDGDNIVTSDVRAYEQLLAPLAEKNVPFTFVFGNHDDESSDLNKEEMLAEYQKYAGCLAFDADPSLHGCATHNLPVLSSDGSKLAFNLWLFDSGDYVYDGEGNSLGYDWVREDQIEWYKQVRDEMKEENNGELVPSMAFQHIIPEEPVKTIFHESYVPLGDLTINFLDGTSTTVIPDMTKFDGYIFEASCPGIGNDGEWDAFVEGGDVLGLVVGHDHVNNFVADVNGVDIIQTPGVTYHSYYNDFFQGARVIEISEDDPWNYETYNLTTAEFAVNGDSTLSELGGRTESDYKFSYYFFRVFDVIVEFFRQFLKETFIYN